MTARHPDSPPEASTEVAVPEEIRRTGAEATHATGCLLAAIFLLFPALLYFGFFALLLVDELVLQTRYLGQENLPPRLVQAIEIVYAPLIYLTRLALGM